MRLIDADKLKAFYAHWDSEYSGEELKELKRVFDDGDCDQYYVCGMPIETFGEDYCSKGEPKEGDTK